VVVVVGMGGNKDTKIDKPTNQQKQCKMANRNRDTKMDIK